MHSDKSKNIQRDDNEEVDLLVAVATLVIEGRIPGTGSNFEEKSKDFHEGPHCNQLIARGNNNKHLCEPQNHLCEQFQINREIIAKHFNNNNNNNKKSSIFCIEVFFNCLCKNFIDFTTKFEKESVLLEQWHFSTSSSLLSKNTLSTNQNFNINQLINAIRSQLYFSQLTAWLVTQDQKSRIISDNIHYRFCTPETLSGSLTFSLTATKHEFPNADLNDGTILKVSFLSASRFPSKPIFHCSHSEGEKEENKINLLDDRMHNFCKVKGKHHCCDSDDDDDDIDEEETKKKLKTPRKNDVINKGQLLLDAIERCGRNECDKKNLNNCDTNNTMNSKNMIINGSLKANNKMQFNNTIIKKINNNNNNNNQMKYILPSNGVKKKLLFENDFLEKNRRNLGNSTSALGLPLSSSPAPVRRGHKNCFEFDSSLNSVSAIKNALFSNSFSTDEESSENEGLISPCSPSELYLIKKPKIKDNFPNLYRRKGRPTNLLGSFEESVLNGRLEPVSTVYGFTAELGASGSFVPEHISVPVVTFFYSFGQNDKVSTPYLGHIRLGKKGYNVPKQGTVQITLFNPLGTVVKMFVLPYDLTDMPISSQTFIRQRIFYMPTKNDKASALENDEDILPQPKWLRFLIHVRFMTSKSGKIYLHSDIRMIIVKKSDMDTATAHDIDRNYELRSFLQIPTNPRFSSRK